MSSPTTARSATARRRPTAATRPASSSTSTSCCASRQGPARSSGGAAPLRRHHDLLAAAPLEGRQGPRVGVLGLGGLGHMAVKIAAMPLGAEVTVLSSSSRRKPDAARARRPRLRLSPRTRTRLQGERRPLRRHPRHRLGAARPTRLSRPPAHATAPCPRRRPDRPAVCPSSRSSWRRRSLAGSLIGGIPETQEMLDFCAEHSAARTSK